MKISESTCISSLREICIYSIHGNQRLSRVQKAKFIHWTAVACGERGPQPVPEARKAEAWMTKFCAETPKCAEASEGSTTGTPETAVCETGVSTAGTGACSATKGSLTACTMDARNCRDISEATNGPEVDVEAEFEETPLTEEVTGAPEIAEESLRDILKESEH